MSPRNASPSSTYSLRSASHRTDSCSVSPSQTGTCGYTTTFLGSDKLDFNPKNSLPVGTQITVTWTMTSSRGEPDVVVTRTFILT